MARLLKQGGARAMGVGLGRARAMGVGLDRARARHGVWREGGWLLNQVGLGPDTRASWALEECLRVHPA